MKPCKRVAIVGGGFAGLMCVKILQEDGIHPVCFEKSSDIGGTWNYREEVVEGIPSTMWTTIVNSSKEIGTISDYPPPAELPNYMKHYQLMNVFRSFVEKYGLMKHVTCNREVICVKKASDYEESGRWVVVVKNTENGEVMSDIFDGVMLCVGSLTYPKVSHFSGLDKFRGEVLHSHDLKRIEPFSGQKVAVIGTGCSALDAAVEISNVANQVYLSVRTPSWIMSRIGPYGLPMDYVMLRRSSAFIQDVLPLKWASGCMERMFLNSKFNHKLYGIEPRYPALSRDPIINDGIASKLLSGSVIIKSDVKAFLEDSIIFENDEDKPTKIDSVIWATGYEWKFPFLEDGILVKKDSRIHLYKCVFPANLKHPTLAFIGFLLPYGPGFPLGELQIRWASYLMSGHDTLPSSEIMLQDVEKRYQENVKRYAPSDRMSIRVDFIPYMNEIASQFGVKPNFWKMMFTDYQLFKACVFGPCVPYQNRLVGHNKWDGARNAILTAPQRMETPLNVNRSTTLKTEKISHTIFKSFVLLAIVTWPIFYKEEATTKYYFLALILPYLVSLKSFNMKHFFALLFLSFCVSYETFVFSYLVTLFVQYVVGMLTSL